MNCFWKKTLGFLGLVIIGCNLSIALQFLHELSCKDWIKHISFAIVFAIAYSLVVYFYRKKRKN